MVNATPMQAYKKYSADDKAVVKELQTIATEQNGGEKIQLSEIISSVEPGIETPAHLKNLTY
jgi:hypothetical protein